MHNSNSFLNALSHFESLLLAACLLVGSSACGEPRGGHLISVVSYQRRVVADDGFALRVFDIHLEGHPRTETPRAWMFYLVGSEPVSLDGTMEQFAEIIESGFVVVLLQPRGVGPDGSVDDSVFRRYETRQRRVADQIAVLSAYLDGALELPVLLVGSSEGGVVAADVAVHDSRVTHLLMMASGGGWTQAEELEWELNHGRRVPEASNIEELHAKFAEIQSDPNGDTMWFGHPFRMWSSYLWFRSMDGLTTSSIPIFLAQGSEDQAIAGSARAMRDGFDRLGLTNLTYVEYPGLDHHFNDAAGESGLAALQRDASAWMEATGLIAGGTQPRAGL